MKHRNKKSFLLGLALALLAAAAAASDLSIRQGRALFSELDGGALDADGTADGTLSLDSLVVSGHGELVVDVPAATIAVTGDVTLAGSGAIRPPADATVGPQVEVTAGGSVRLTGSSEINVDGADEGGRLTICAAGEIELKGATLVSASSPAGPGGAINLQAGGQVLVSDPAGFLAANGTDGGSIRIVSCAEDRGQPAPAINASAIALKGRFEAVGTSGNGGTVDVEARQGGVALHEVLASVDARGATADGSVTITAATDVAPDPPPTVPAALVLTDTPSAATCGCDAEELVVLADVDRPSGVVGTLFTLTAHVLQSAAPVIDLQWDLGDGQTASGESVTAVYDTPGLFLPTVVATSADGSVAQAEVAVVVFDPATQAPPELGLPDLVGDVDGDLAITLADAHLIAKHATGLQPLDELDVPAADVDLNGDVGSDDALLLARAVIAGRKLPSVLQPASGAPGTVVNLVSPELLDAESVVDVEVGASQLVQRPFRPARGYATFLIPLDPTTPDSVDVTPGPVDVRILRDGQVVETLTFEIEEPEALPADPKAELKSFLDDYVTLLERAETELAAALDFADVTPETKDLMLSILTVQTRVTADGVAQLQALLDQEGGDELAELFFIFASANGLSDYREELDTFLQGGLAALEKIEPGEVCDTILPVLCTTKKLSELIDTGGDIVGYACDALLIAALIAAVVPADGPVVDAALLASWAAGCGTVETALEFGSLVRDFVGDLDASLMLEADPTSPGAGEPVILSGEVELIGLDDICTFGSGQGADAIKKKLAEATVKRLLKKKLALKAIAKVAEKLSPKVIEKLTELLEDVAGKIIDETGVADAFKEFADKVCAAYGLGAALPVDLSGILQGPTPSFGTLTFKADGTGEYMCPDDPGPDPPDSVSFTATKEICDDTAEEMVSVTCETRPVTITIGDNGSLNDDIFEVRIDGRTVLTSSVPVRSISTTVQLPVGDTTVQMIGRAAPDGIGTYFIRFSGATVIGGDATSGTDLTPGVVKTFTIRVQ